MKYSQAAHDLIGALENLTEYNKMCDYSSESVLTRQFHLWELQKEVNRLAWKLSLDVMDDFRNDGGNSLDLVGKK